MKPKYNCRVFSNARVFVSYHLQVGIVKCVPTASRENQLLPWVTSLPS